MKTTPFLVHNIIKQSAKQMQRFSLEFLLVVIKLTLNLSYINVSQSTSSWKTQTKQLKNNNN